jgi:lambda family phage tail tape measure protein
MVASLDTAIRLSAEVKGGGNIDRVKRSLQDLGKSSQVSARQIDLLYLETQKLSKVSNSSVNALNQQKAALESLRNSVNPASRRYALLSQDIAKVTASLKEADATAAGFSLAAALTTSTTAAAAGMVSFGGFTASTQSVAAALSRMGVSGSKASEMLRSLQGEASSTTVTAQKLNLTLNQAFASTPEKAAAQINTMRQALAQLKIGSEEYLKALVRVNEAEAVSQARTGRSAVIAANKAYAGPTMTSGYGSNVRLPGLPNTMAADMQRVSELTARVQNLDRSTDEYRRSLQELEAVQKRLNGQPGRNRMGFRDAAASAAGVVAMGGGPMSALGAIGGSLASSGGAAGLAAAGGISAAVGIGVLASRVGVDAETAEVRLRALTEQFGEYNQAQAAAARIADTLRISQIEAADGFSKLYGALRPTGITLKEIEDAFVGFTAAARASGATADESRFALVQLKQALGSGILQGDELRSIREQAPAVGQAIAKEMGVTIGELKKLGEQGKITTDVVIRALAKLRGEKLGQLNDQFKTSAQAIKDLQVATEDFGRTVARAFGPATVGILRTFTGLLDRVNDGFTGFSNAQLEIQARSQASREAQKKFGPLGQLLNGGQYNAFVDQRSEQLRRQIQQQRAASPDRASAEQQSARAAAAAERNAARARAAAGGSGTSAAARRAEAAAERRADADAKRAANEQERILERRQELTKQALTLQEQLRRSLEDVTAEMAGVGASDADKLWLQRNDAITENNRQVDGLTKSVAELYREVQAAGGQLDIAPFRALIDQISAANVALADANYQEGMADLWSRQGEAIDRATESVWENARALQYNSDIMGGLKDGLTGYIEQVGTMREALSNLGQQAFKGVEDSLVSLVTTGTANYKEFARSILESTSRIIIQQIVLKTIMQAIGGISGGSSIGGFTQFNAGGVGFNPVAFSGVSFAGGGFTGSGPRSGGLDGQGGFMAMLHPRETVIDHTRPMALQGGGTTSVVVNVDASGSQVQGNTGQADALGRDLAAVVDSRLVYHKRPGGLLAPR